MSASYQPTPEQFETLRASHEALEAKCARLASALNEVLDLCELGDIDESTEALGWGEAYANGRTALAS